MTAMRVMLLLVMAGASAVVVFALFADMPGVRLPLIVSGLAVAGIASAIFGFSLAGSAVRLGERGRGWPALGVAFLGGLFVLGAAGALAGAIVLGILAGAA